jgi:hypothetical protein
MSNQLEGIEQKDIIKRVTGKVTKLWEPKTFNGPKGEFVIQGGDIEIDGQTYGLKFFNNTQEQSIKGNVVTLSSVRGKHGLTGVSLEHESYEGKNGKVDRDIIKVTATGKVEFDRPSEEPARVTSAPKVIVTDNPEKALDEIVETHLYIDSLVRMAYLGKITDEETLRSYVSSVFIEANRKGIHYSTKVEEPKPHSRDTSCDKVSREELDPADWASVIVPSGSHKGKKLAEIGKPALTKLYEYYLEKGFTTPFAKCVEKAAEDLNLDAPAGEEEDNIPW